jgi:hypothetical protein
LSKARARDFAGAKYVGLSKGWAGKAGSGGAPEVAAKYIFSIPRGPADELNLSQDQYLGGALRRTFFSYSRRNHDLRIGVPRLAEAVAPRSAQGFIHCKSRAASGAIRLLSGVE